ncbi:MAG: 4Fe-4S dicluster domain-containing protein [Chitinophagaceae bacterium]|nr:MAG: 4Fe-4S dicluster domain-containing protein [Chitinophagaceae bacterium]
MSTENDNSSNLSNRRNFLKVGLIAGGSIAAGTLVVSQIVSNKKTETGVKKTVFTQDGKVYTADQSHLHEYEIPPVTNEEARKGIEGKKFVMVIDIAKCDGCKKCTDACQAMHFTEPDREWIKVYKMKDAETTAPYYFPKPCFHCDNPPCTKVCPVNATFKRQDGIVLIDNERCIGCRSCMVACPYSTRFFNWSHPKVQPEIANAVYSPEKSFPRKIGTVEKCDFCPDMIRQDKMPACVSACSMDAIYFGDQNEDAVTNASGITVKLSQLLEDNAGYRYLEELGTDPRVYYLPPKNRKYPKPDIDNEEKEKKEATHMDMDGMKM